MGCLLRLGWERRQSWCLERCGAPKKGEAFAESCNRVLVTLDTYERGRGLFDGLTIPCLRVRVRFRTSVRIRVRVRVRVCDHVHDHIHGRKVGDGDKNYGRPHNRVHDDDGVLAGGRNDGHGGSCPDDRREVHPHLR